MSCRRIATLTTLAMIAFAGNSVLCRLALKQTSLDAASFTAIRLLAGAVVLGVVVLLRRSSRRGSGSWWSAGVLFAYAACFSFAYRYVSLATGALLLFGAVQATMIGHGVLTGEPLRGLPLVGLLLALGGLVGLLLPGLSAPPLLGALLMIAAGVAWGIYSLRGRGNGDPARVTAGNFVRAVPFAVGLSLLLLSSAQLDSRGVWYAVASGAMASGVGYAIWYAVVPSLNATRAATVQLSVPIIAAFGGVLFLGEVVTIRLVATSAAILGGIALVILAKQPVSTVQAVSSHCNP